MQSPSKALRAFAQHHEGWTFFGIVAAICSAVALIGAGIGLIAHAVTP